MAVYTVHVPGRASIFYVDIRHVPVPEKISLDLSRHLARRMVAGPAAIINDRPLVLLSVVKKRWTRVIHDVERQYASTLDRAKKQSLRHELGRLRNYCFSAKLLKDQPVDILFLASAQLLPNAVYPTIYLTAPIRWSDAPQVTVHLSSEGVLVIYTDTQEEESILAQIKTGHGPGISIGGR